MLERTPAHINQCGFCELTEQVVLMPELIKQVVLMLDLFAHIQKPGSAYEETPNAQLIEEDIENQVLILGIYARTKDLNTGGYRPSDRRVLLCRVDERQGIWCRGQLLMKAAY